jgi:hypothetical protein
MPVPKEAKIEPRLFHTLSSISELSMLFSVSVMNIVLSLKRQWVKAGVLILALIVCALYFFASFFYASSYEPVQSNSITDHIPLSPIRGKDVVLIMGSNGDHHLSAHEALIRANRMEYAEFHGGLSYTHMLMLGYDFFEANFSEHPVPNVGPHWSKIPVFAEAFKRYPEAKWLWWLDFDAIIMTPTIDLGSHLLDPDAMYSRLIKGEAFPIMSAYVPPDKYMDLPEDPDVSEINLLISGDNYGRINSGSMFLRRSEWTDMLLDLWIDPFYIEHNEDWYYTQEQEVLVHLMRFHQFIRDHIGIMPQRLINADGDGADDARWQPNDLVVHIAGCW